MALNDYDVFISQSPRGGRLCENQNMALNDYDVFISQSPRGGRLCENQRFENLESIRMEFDQLNT
jgi:hypothetical protein